MPYQNLPIKSHTNYCSRIELIISIKKKKKKTEKSEIKIQIVVDTLVSELLCSNLRETVIR